MKAVNLIPMDARRGAGAPDRSGGAVYGALGVLGVLAVIAVLYGLSARSLNSQEEQLAQLTADSTTGVAAAAALEPYVRFGQIADEREQTVVTIADQRFDWGLAMREIARVLPGNVDLVSLDGTRQGATAAAGSETASVGAPQITMSGCATSQASVALLMARLRAIQGVDRVRLESSSKGGEAGAGASSGGDCRGGDEEKPQFTMAVIFRAADPAASAQAGSTAEPAAQSGAAPTAPQEGSS